MKRAILAFGCLLATFSAAAAGHDDPFGFTATGAPLATGPVEGLTPAEASTCLPCHADVVAEWQPSMHARSFIDPIFQAELVGTHDQRACRSCHAPLASTVADGAALGIGCPTCHVRNGTILGARRAPRGMPHPLHVVPALARVDACAGCHDFHFPASSSPEDIPFDAEVLQQATVHEWRTSPSFARGETCADCHMPSVARASGRIGHSHRVRALDDAAFVASSLDVRVDATVVGETTQVTFRLVVAAAGHAVPTGDPFRLLHVRAENDRGFASREMRRNFAEVVTDDGVVRRDVFDDRVLPGAPREITLELPGDAGNVRYAITLHRLDLGIARGRGIAETSVVVPVASGEVVVRRDTATDRLSLRRTLGAGDTSDVGNTR